METRQGQSTHLVFTWAAGLSEVIKIGLKSLSFRGQ